MTLSPALRDKIIRSVDDNFADQLAFTRDMIRHPSTRGNEHTMQDFMFRAMRDRGMAMDRFDMDPEAIARHPGGSKWSDTHSRAPIVVGINRPKNEAGRSLIMQGHVDVVPTGPTEMWTHPPFDPVVDGDWLYGRGGADMKAGCAANIFALDALKRAGLRPAGTVYVQSVVEEESTGNGALMTHLRGYKADAALIPEPMGEEVTSANIGVLWFTIDVEGHPVHVRDMGTGVNAIDKAYRVIAELRKLEEEWNAKRLDDPDFKDHPHPINLNIGKIVGGDWASSVPCWTHVDCRISMLPGTHAADAAREIESRVSAFARSDKAFANTPPKITFNGFFAEGYRLPRGTEAESVLGRAHEAVFGAPLRRSVSTAYLDARVYALYDKIPALNYGCRGENIHGFDERASIASIKQITTAMALFVAEWCGTEAA